jgi:hypothetical protein
MTPQRLADGTLNPDWLAARCGRITASQMWRVVGRKKTGEPTSEWQSYMVELLSEQSTGDAVGRYVTAAMQHGIDTEPAAIAAYEDVTGTIVEPCGLLDAGNYLATPDGVVIGDGGLVECKCPLTTTVTRLRYFDRAIPAAWRWQMIAQIAAADAPWCDLVLYDDRIRRARDRITIVRLTAEEVAADIEQMHEAIAEFLAELERRLSVGPWDGGA